MSKDEECLTSLDDRIAILENKSMVESGEIHSRLLRIENLLSALHLDPSPAVSSSDISPSQSVLNLNETKYQDLKNISSKNVIKVQPPNFDGTTSWEVFRAQFEEVAKINGWNSIKMARSLLIALKGSALESFKNMSLEIHNYHELANALELKYGELHRKAKINRAQLQSRIHRPNETLREFAVEIGKLAYEAYPTAPEELKEYLAIQTFINGLRDSYMRRTLYLEDHITLKSALEHAILLEAAEATSRTSLLKLNQSKWTKLLRKQSPSNIKPQSSVSSSKGETCSLEGTEPINMRNPSNSQRRVFRGRNQERENLRQFFSRHSCSIV